MVNSELIHNPYLLETSVKFNGQAPRINSQIEKYEGMLLKDWVERVPQLYYDEMNGYDFDLDYTGTKADFEEVRKAFEKSGISQDLVRLFHKNELEDVDKKCEEVAELISWIKGNPNRKFNADQFFSKNVENLECVFPYVIIGGLLPEDMDRRISPEVVSSAKELENTVLQNTPILLWIDKNTEKQFRDDLHTLLMRQDVQQSQLFFMIHPYLNTDQMVRVIFDLGVEQPQVISSASDIDILEYMRNYPMTEYIRGVIKLFEQTVQEISQVLDRENEDSIRTNAEIHCAIEKLEDGIEHLKESDLLFTERDNFQAPKEFHDKMQELVDHICKWRNRKTKVIGDQEAKLAAGELCRETAKYFELFVDAVHAESITAMEEIDRIFGEQYLRADYDDDFYISHQEVIPRAQNEVEPMEEQLLALKVITYEEPKGDLIDLFWKSSSKEERAPIRVATCYYEQWRDKVLGNILPEIKEVMEYYSQWLSQYYSRQAQRYHEHLTELIRVQTEEKEKVSGQLSDDERKLQEDNNWLQSVRDRLTRIERG